MVKKVCTSLRPIKRMLNQYKGYLFAGANEEQWSGIFASATRFVCGFILFSILFDY